MGRRIPRPDRVPRCLRVRRYWKTPLASRQQGDAFLTESNNNEVPLTAQLAPRLEMIIADLAIEIWRLERRLVRVENKVGSAVVSPLRESVVRMQDRLEVSGIEFRDHNGEEFIDGLLLKVVHVETASDRLFVSETLQPTVVLNDRVIAHGHVVLSGRPEDDVKGALAHGSGDH
jgi:hypothetical protein